MSIPFGDQKKKNTLSFDKLNVQTRTLTPGRPLTPNPVTLNKCPANGA